MDRDKNSAGLVGNGGLPLPQESQEFVEMRCGCGSWPSLTPMLCSDFRRGESWQDDLFCMEVAAQGKSYSAKSGK